jgi:hypothetical protein
MKKRVLSIGYVLIGASLLEASNPPHRANGDGILIDTTHIQEIVEEIKRQTEGMSERSAQIALFERNPQWLDLPYDQLVTVNGHKIILSWWIDLLDDMNQEGKIKTSYYLRGGKPHIDAMVSFLQERMINIATFADRLTSDPQMASTCNPFDWCALNHQALGCYIEACELFHPVLAEVKRTYGDAWNMHRGSFDVSDGRQAYIQKAQQDAFLMKELKEKCEAPVKQRAETQDEASMRVICEQFAAHERYKSIPWLRDLEITTQFGKYSLEEYVLVMAEQGNAHALTVAREWWNIILQTASFEDIVEEIEYLPTLYKSINPFTVARVFSDTYDSLGAEVESLCREGDEAARKKARKIKEFYTEATWNEYKRALGLDQSVIRHDQPLANSQRPLLTRSKGEGGVPTLLHNFFLHLQSQGFKVAPGQSIEELIAECNAGMTACLEVQGCMQGDWILTSRGREALKQYAQATFMARHIERIKRELPPYLTSALDKDLSKERLENFESWMTLLEEEHVEFDGAIKISEYQKLLSTQKDLLDYRVRGARATQSSSYGVPKLFGALCLGSFIYALYAQYQQKKAKHTHAIEEGSSQSHTPSGA